VRGLAIKSPRKLKSKKKKRGFDWPANVTRRHEVTAKIRSEEGKKDEKPPRGSRRGMMMMDVEISRVRLEMCSNFIFKNV